MMHPRRTPVALPWVAGLSAVALLVSGCGGSGDPSGDASGGASADPSASASSSASASASGGPNAAYGLDVPSGVALTPLGTDLNVGDDATVAWEPTQETVGVISLQVTRMRSGTWKDFAGFTLDEKAKAGTPYYVDVTVTNDGTSDLSGAAVPLYALDDADRLVVASSFQSRFEPCAAQPLPKAFTAGKKAEVCLVYVVPEGGTLAGVSFRPVETYDPIVWSGTVLTPKQAARQDAAEKRREKRREQQDKGSKNGRG